MVAANEKNYVEHLDVMLYRNDLERQGKKRQPREMSDKRYLSLKQECGWFNRLPWYFGIQRVWGGTPIWSFFLSGLPCKADT